MASPSPCSVSGSSVNSDICSEYSLNKHPYCELLHKDEQTLRSEVKSLTEIINILNSELKTIRTTKEAIVHKKPSAAEKLPTLHCRNCAQLEIKLQKAQEEINSQKLIIKLLNEDNKPVNQSQQPNLKTNEEPDPDKTFFCPARRKKTYFSQHTLNYKQYDPYVIPVSNRYDVLYSFPDQPTRYPPPATHKDFPSHKILQRSKNHNSKSTYCPADYVKDDPTSRAPQSNIQVSEPDQDISTIPTIINGVITKHTAASSNPSSNTINHIDNLLSVIKDQNKCTNQRNITHKLVLIGDSHIKGFAAALQSVFNSEYEIFSVVKPGSNSNMLSESITATVTQLSKDDVLVISSGTNDYELDNFKQTFRNIRDYLSPLLHTNIVVLSIPHRYDLHDCTVVNSKISRINKMLSKLAYLSPNISFLDSNNDSNLFTRHGLHRNKLGKKLVIAQIANHIFSIFKCKTVISIPLVWHRLTEMPIDENQNIRNSNRHRKIPVTRSDDFLW
jgi:hypothetical protein